MAVNCSTAAPVVGRGVGGRVLIDVIFAATGTSKREMDDFFTWPSTSLVKNVATVADVGP